MCNLGASEDQLNFPTVYGSSKQGWMSEDYTKPTTDVSYLLDQIIKYIPAYPHLEGNTQLMISSLDYSSYVGRIAVGRLHRGTLQAWTICYTFKSKWRNGLSKIKELYVFEGLAKEKIKTPVEAGEIVAVLGLDNFEIGDTICDIEIPAT
jgi:GTP-binding protein